MGPTISYNGDAFKPSVMEKIDMGVLVNTSDRMVCKHENRGIIWNNEGWLKEVFLFVNVFEIKHNRMLTQKLLLHDPQPKKLHEHNTVAILQCAHVL